MSRDMPKDPPKDPSGKPMWYGRRRTHKLRPGRQHLVDELLPQLLIADASSAGPVVFEPGFGPPARELRLEIGFGAGEHLSGEAAANPDIDFIGCEPFINGLAALLADVESMGLGNIRLFDDDVRLLLERLPEASVSRIYILFPDPWPKARHNRRRIFQAETLSALARIARDDTVLLFASDHMDYVAWALGEARRHPDWSWTAQGPEDWRRPPADWVPTRYETKALAKGDKPAYLSFRRRFRP
ncbi:tRNA (guanine(46)-N(7))-methyltransferase TrmB [Thalassospiraceae bacterium LMO-JJ14]|nr:tRNA (guanine(46)-N(7))-methyltransferase TrmB [Thalassospiraceae bacterium LMO-JJ14]